MKNQKTAISKKIVFFLRFFSSNFLSFSFWDSEDPFGSFLSFPLLDDFFTKGSKSSVKHEKSK